MPSNSRMEDQLAYLIASVNRQLEDELAETLKPEGIPIEQFRILSALTSVDARSMRDLAAAVLIDPASLTKIIDRMVSEALVYRTLDPGDRRKVLICIADKGKALYARLQGLHEDQQKRLISQLSAQKVGELALILRGLIER